MQASSRIAEKARSRQTTEIPSLVSGGSLERLRPAVRGGGRYGAVGLLWLPRRRLATFPPPESITRVTAMKACPTIPARPSSLCALVLLAAFSGCAGWSPFVNKEKAARDRERYGPTADQRMKKLGEDVATAKAGTAEQQAEFTRQLAATMLAEHDPRVRSRILEAAAEFDTPAAAAICRGALQDPDERVRMEACAAWGKRGGPEAVELLAARYRSDAELDVRLRAIRSLGESGDPTAIAVLARALEDSDPAVQYRAVAALKRVSGRDLGDDVNKWREWAADPEGSAAGEWSIAEQFRKIF